MRIYSIFNSIDGECNHWGQGTFSTFVRFAGCNLRCKACDTQYAQKENSGEDMSLDEVFKHINSYGCKKVTITGGEPLLQVREVTTLMDKLFSNGYKISVETNGTQPIPLYFRWSKELSWVVDCKLGDEILINPQAFDTLIDKDFVKIVVQEYDDLLKSQWVKEELLGMGCKANFFISPLWGYYALPMLVKDMKKLKMFDFGINIQIHKLIWPKSLTEV